MSSKGVGFVSGGALTGSFSSSSSESEERPPSSLYLQEEDQNVSELYRHLLSIRANKSFIKKRGRER